MRALLLLMLAIAVDAGESTPGERLRAVGEDWQAVNHALIQLRQGQVEALAALPPRLFTEPLAAADPGDEDAPERHWTAYLPRVLAELDVNQRTRALATLEACYHGRLAQGDLPAAALATRFLPTPTAVSALRRERDRAFDRGEFRRCLALDAMLADAGDETDEDRRRRDVARRFSGHAVEVDESVALAAPGLPIPIEARKRAHDGGLTVTWSVAAGTLAALDPWGQSRWSRAIERDARIVTGPGGAIVVGSRGVRLVDEAGAMVEQPSPPPGTRALAVAGGAAWFARDLVVHRVDLVSGSVSAFALPDPPIGAPVARGDRSVWLTDRRVVLVAEGGVVGSVLHGLTTRSSWSLCTDEGRVLIDGGADGDWWVEPQQRQWGRWRREPGSLAELARATGAWRRILGLRDLWERPGSGAFDDEQVRSAVVAADAMAAREKTFDPMFPVYRSDDSHTPAERALVFLEIWRNKIQGGGIDNLNNLERELANAPADARFPGPDSPVIEPVASWWHVLGTRGLRRALATMTRAAAAIDLHRPVASETVAVADGPRRRDADGLAIALEHEPGITMATVRDPADGALMWRNRWRAAPLDSAPGRSWACIDGSLIVGEGAERLVALALSDGTRLGHVDLIACDARPAQATVMVEDPLTIAILHPLGIERSLTIATPAGERTIALAARPRWTVPVPGGRLLVVFADRALTVGGEGDAVACELPDELRDGGEPTPTARGLARDGRLWAWTSAAKE